jgi:bisphosphoglycerate-independent phosphoglycerate mutase (AlkP superfamily)
MARGLLSVLAPGNPHIEKAILDNISNRVISNFANADMVGHTGVLPAANGSFDSKLYDLRHE